ncbi:hypothetical protein [Streptomyces odontomachi]|uniref:hypothetical protein n=1 Tax=Streptomyces odontomachi TaxID=2944940 RepID=UPI0021096155|nr:hypothetical protein [Streptomyces sp. ODS25]
MSAELRDRFFALSTGTASADEVARYLAEVDAIDTEPVTTLDGLAISWHPTARHKAVRFVDAERIDADVRELFARPSTAAPYLAAVFVDPRELSFRTFENILPLDRLFEDTPLKLDLTDRVELTEGAYTFSLGLPDAARACLERLDSLDLYVPPLNAGSRGGERFIFHSTLLAEALTEAVTAAAPEPLREGFSHVNPVFRCNRFEPGDPLFHRHRDTPYYDAERQHVSRYTVLIYLTGGTGDPALDLTEGVELTTVAPFTCVIFDQRYEHEGAPFQDGRKVFLRTELIFTESEVAHDPEIGALFSKATYLTGESVFAPELARHADAYYNQVAEAHWSGLTPRADREPFVHKQFRGLHFVTNGYDFWFARSEALSLTECAAIALLDYFNCKLGENAFRALCETEVIEADDAAWIPDFLAGRAGESVIAPVDKSFFFPDPEAPDPSVCCPFHQWSGFDATRHEDIVDLYTDAQSFAEAHILPAPIVMLGEDVLLDPEKFVIQDNAIHVLGKESLKPVNFAACWNAGGLPENYIDVATTVDVAHFLVPPILFTDSERLYHLRFDFFRNSWMVKHQQAKVPVPMIYRGVCDDGDPQPWMEAVDRSLVPDEDHSERQAALWWIDAPAATGELYESLIEADYDEDED